MTPTPREATVTTWIRLPGTTLPEPADALGLPRVKRARPSLADRFHADSCPVCTPNAAAGLFVDQLAEAVAQELDAPAPAPHDPYLTTGQRHLFNTERDRLCRLLDVRDSDGGPDPARIVAAIVLLDDIATQAPHLDDAHRDQDARTARLPDLIEVD